MKKRSQISLFIIIGVCLIIIIALTYFLLARQSEVEQTQDFVPSIPSDSISSYVQDCLDQQLQITIFKLGIYGGYMEPKYVYSGDFFDTSYLYYKGENLVPSISDLENSISFYLDNTLHERCLLSIFDGYNFEIGDVKTSTKINEDNVLVNIDWPITIKLLDDSKTINMFSSRHEIDLVKMNNFVKEIIEKHEPEQIDMLLLLEPGYNITIVPKDGDYLYLIKDTDSNVIDENFRFMFAIKDE